MATEREIALSGNVEERALARLDAPDAATSDGLEVDVPVDSNVLEISYTAATAQDALLGATIFTQAYLDYRNELSASRRDAPSLPVAEVITPAEEPSDPVSKRYPLVVAISALLGLALAAATAVVRDRMSGRLRDSTRVQELVGRPVLAELTTSVTAGASGSSTGGSAPEQEAYGQLAARLLHEARRGSGSSVLLTSATDVAGKSIVAANITASIAATGKKVVLVRRGRHAQSVDPAHQPEAAAANRQALDRTWLDGVPGVSISMLPATSESSAATLQALRKVLLEADRSALTVIDGDSVLAHEATPLVADVAALTLLVVDRRHETTDEVEAAVSALAHLDGRLLGCVLVDPGKSGPLDRFRRRDDA